MRMRNSSAAKAVRLSVLAGFLTLASVTPSFSESGNSLTVSSHPDLINWVVGPSKADLGYTAQIEVPAGFRFAGKGDAALVLRSMGNPAPESLAGLIAPIGGNYVIVFEYNPIGYVKTAGKETIDAEAVLAGVRQNIAAKRGGAPEVGSIEWQMEPRFDSSRNVLEWAILAGNGPKKIVNHVIRLLGREGVLDGIAVQTSGSSAPVPLRQLMAGVTFKSGYAYADYRKGDRVAAHGLADLVASGTPVAQKAGFPYVWVLSGGTAIVLTAGAVLFVRRKPRKAPSPMQQAAAAAQAENAPYKPISATLRSNDHSNGDGSGKLNGHKTHRRRTFDYQKFYADLMFQVSDQGLQPTFVSPPRSRATEKRVESKPQTNGVQNVEAISASANASLIESQKRLIEEQQRLIREQSKLIEEKTRLIHEKNQVLDKQTELFGNNIF